MFPDSQKSVNTCTVQVLLAFVFCSALWADNTAFAQSRGPELKAVEVIWGFNGRVQPGQFNPLSILLDNQTDKAIDADITLQQVTPRLSTRGGQYAQKTFISPSGRRWVQFYPYIPQSYQTEWQLTVNDDEKYVNHPIGKPFTQARAVTRKETADEKIWPQVVFLGDDIVRQLPPSVKYLPEDIFPPYVTATVGLHTVFLDHEPDWELPRQQAFLSWLKLGGQLHLLHNSRGEFPRFSGVLGDLNQPLNRYSIGSGMVSRQAIRRQELTEGVVRTAVVVNVMPTEDDILDNAVSAQRKSANPDLSELIPIDLSTSDDTLFRGMRELTHPDHSWWLIFLLALCYIGLIFPGCFLISKQKNRDFLSTYGAIVGLAIVFSLLFLVIGRRGYGESTSLQTLAVARAEDDGHWNVFQWNTLFVTSGDTYSATTTDQQMLLSIADSDSNDNSSVTPGNSAEARMRIPPYSSQAFVSRRRVPAKPWKLRVVKANIHESGMVSLAIEVGDNFPIDADTQYFVLSGRSLYEMRYVPETKQLTLFGARKRLAVFCQPRYRFDQMNSWAAKPEEPDTRTDEEIFFDLSLPELVNRSLVDSLVDNVKEFQLPADRVRLFVYTPVPDEFDVNVSTGANRWGRILFTKDVPLTSEPGEAESAP